MARRAPDGQETTSAAAPDVVTDGSAGDSEPGEPGDVAGLTRHARWRGAARDLVPVAVVVVVVGVPLAHIAWTALSTPGAIWFGVDVPQMELRTLAASRGHLALGSFSQYGWQHPGPSLYYWYAPFYAATGRQPAGMIVGAVVANVVGLAALVLAVGRVGGRRAGWVAAAVVVAFVLRFGLTGLWVSWNPNLTVVPTALLIVATAALLCGHRWMLPAVALLASWIVQAHLGTVLVVGGLCALAVAGGWIAGRGDRRAWLAPALAAAGTAAVFWAAPVGDQVAGTHNMRTVAAYLVHNRLGDGANGFAGHRGPAFGRGEALEEVGLVGSLLAGHEPGRVAGPDRFYTRGIGTSAALAVVFALLVLADAACAVACRRRGLRFPAALCATAVLASLLAYASALGARGNPSHHILAFAAGIGLAAWLALALAVVELVASRRPTPAPAARTPAPRAGRPGRGGRLPGRGGRRRHRAARAPPVPPDRRRHARAGRGPRRDRRPPRRAHRGRRRPRQRGAAALGRREVGRGRLRRARDRPLGGVRHPRAGDAGDLGPDDLPRRRRRPAVRPDLAPPRVGDLPAGPHDHDLQPPRAGHLSRAPRSTASRIWSADAMPRTERVARWNSAALSQKAAEAPERRADAWSTE